ncbi:MAG: restriction endonuclease [Patescibacteria group bacterium]
MASYYRKKKNNDQDQAIGCITVAIFIYLAILVASLATGEFLSFFIWLGLGVGAFLIYKWYKISQEENKQNKINNILNAIEQAGLEGHINNFISRFGLGQEKDRNVWTRRNYKISWNRINDLRDFLQQKGIEFSPAEICILLSNYIDKKEYDVTCNSISAITNNFSKLSGSDFEKLLYRLYESMGYSVQLNGKTGDQGGDLIATRDQERILIQAKCYNNWSVGNSAVQEAAAAKVHYDCNRAVVVATNTFTREAIDLAKTNNVDLISKDILQKMLLDNLKESWG